MSEENDDIDDEHELVMTASSLRNHTTWLVREVKKAAGMLERAGEELDVLRDVQWIVNRGTMETGGGTAAEALENARGFVAGADAHLARQQKRQVLIVWCRDMAGRGEHQPPSDHAQIFNQIADELEGP